MPIHIQSSTRRLKVRRKLFCNSNWSVNSTPFSHKRWPIDTVAEKLSVSLLLTINSAEVYCEIWSLRDAWIIHFAVLTSVFTQHNRYTNLNWSIMWRNSFEWSAFWSLTVQEVNCVLFDATRRQNNVFFYYICSLLDIHL